MCKEMKRKTKKEEAERDKNKEERKGIEYTKHVAITYVTRGQHRPTSRRAVSPDPSLIRSTQRADVNDALSAITASHTKLRVKQQLQRAKNQSQRAKNHIKTRYVSKTSHNVPKSYKVPKTSNNVPKNNYNVSKQLQRVKTQLQRAKKQLQRAPPKKRYRAMPHNDF